MRYKVKNIITSISLEKNINLKLIYMYKILYYRIGNFYSEISNLSETIINDR